MPADRAKPLPNSRYRGSLGILLTHRLGAPAIVVLSVLVLAAISAPIIAPFDPTKINYEAILSPPNPVFWLGTDEIGRDLLSRILFGARTSLWIMFVSVGLAMGIGTVIGLISGYFGGVLDAVIMRTMDALLAFPVLILALGIIAVLGPGLTNAMIALAVVNVPQFARLARGQALAIRQSEHVDAARSIGATNTRIIALHIWPEAMNSLLVFATLRASSAIITESSLSFLGLGAQPPVPTWGYMLATSIGYWDAWWMSVFPGCAIFVTVLALNFAGDALRDLFDTRQNL